MKKLKSTKMKLIISLIILASAILKGTHQFTFTMSPSLFHTYEIKQDLISDTCSSYNIPTFSRSVITLQDQRKKFEALYIDGENDLMKKYIETKDPEVLEEIKEQAASKIWIHYFMTGITLVFFIIATLYLIMRCFKRCRRKISKMRMKRAGVTLKSKRRNRNYSNKCLTLVNTKRFRCLMYCLNVLIGVFIALAAFRWRYVALDAVEAFKSTDCSMSRFYNGIENGFVTHYKQGLYFKYLGINGLLHFFQKVHSEVAELEPYSGDYRLFLDAATRLSNSMFDFDDQFSFKNVVSPLKYQGKITPDISLDIGRKRLTDNNFFQNVQEVRNIRSSIYNIERLLVNLDDVKKTKYFFVMDKMLVKLTEVKQGLRELRDMTSIFEYKVRGPFFRFFINLISIGFIVGLSIYCLAFTCSFALQKMLKPAVFFQALFTIFMLVLTVSTQIFGIISYKNSYLWAKACAYNTAFLSDPELSGKEIPGAFFDYAKSCIYSGSSGLAENMLSLDKRLAFNDVMRIVKSGSITLEDGSELQSPEQSSLLKNLNLFIQDIDSLKDYSKNGFTQKKKDDEEKPRNVVKTINEAISCTSNEVQLKSRDCTRTPRSSLSDQKDYKKEENYCLVPNYFSPFDVAGRYSSTCLGDASTSAEAKIETLIRFNKDYQSLLDSIKTTLNSNIKPIAEDAARELVTGNNAQKFPQEMRKMMQFSMEFYSEAEYEDGNNCRNINLYLDEFVGNLCYEFVFNFREQATLVLYLSPLMFVFSCLNFFGLIGSRTKMIEEDMYGLGAVRSSTNFMEDEVFKRHNVDQAPIGWNRASNREENPSNFGKRLPIKRMDSDRFEFEEDLSSSGKTFGGEKFSVEKDNGFLNENEKISGKRKLPKMNERDRIRIEKRELEAEGFD